MAMPSLKETEVPRADDIRVRLSEIEDELNCTRATAEDADDGNEADIDDLLIEQHDLTIELQELEGV